MTVLSAARLNHLKSFYALIDRLAVKMGGTLCLGQCTGGATWPHRGVYFFFEDGEDRSDSGRGRRLVRVGTHALKTGSKTTLWTRLSQHRGTQRSGGGNHRGSVFRLHVGTALLNSTDLACPSWATGNTARGDVRKAEQAVEARVSKVIGTMTVLCLPVDDEAGADSDRGYIERNAIALLSNYRKDPIDAPSRYWLGRHCRSEKVSASGMWNSNHVDETYDPDFLARFSALIESA